MIGERPGGGVVIFYVESQPVRVNRGAGDIAMDIISDGKAAR
jgi:hypothetical protein